MMSTLDKRASDASFISNESEILSENEQVQVQPKYVMVMRQQPERARLCGATDGERRTIDPVRFLYNASSLLLWKYLKKMQMV